MSWLLQIVVCIKTFPFTIYLHFLHSRGQEILYQPEPETKLGKMPKRESIAHWDCVILLQAFRSGLGQILKSNAKNNDLDFSVFKFYILLRQCLHCKIIQVI